MAAGLPGESFMKVLMVLAHPRRASLTGQAADAFAAAATANGHSVEWADLHAEGFDPVLREADEPDWNDARKVYSPEVRREMARIERNEATVMVFPVWWWSVPAMLKGWIDRVWNNGWAYGERTFPQRRARMVGIAGTGPEGYRKRGYDTAMITQLDIGILDYCRIAERRLELLHGSIEGAPYPAQIVAAARALGEAF
jgi:NAD(P)H dehydrogenase (quinone)